MTIQVVSLVFRVVTVPTMVRSSTLANPDTGGVLLSSLQTVPLSVAWTITTGMPTVRPTVMRKGSRFAV